MIVVLFEVTVKEGCMDGYLALAGALKESLATAAGFIRVERFSSMANERKLLSMSVWHNESAVEQWRNVALHRLSQQQGRDGVFESYTITVASAVRTYTDADRVEAPQDSNRMFSDQ